MSGIWTLSGKIEARCRLCWREDLYVEEHFSGFGGGWEMQTACQPSFRLWSLAVGSRVANQLYIDVAEKCEVCCRECRRRDRYSENLLVSVRRKWEMQNNVFVFICRACTVSSWIAGVPCRNLNAEVWTTMTGVEDRRLPRWRTSWWCWGDLEKCRLTDAFDSVRGVCRVGSRVTDAPIMAHSTEAWEMM